MITTLFFDLDGTLLPMDLELYTETYVKTLAAAMVPHGFDPHFLASNVMKSIGVMGEHDPALTNEEAFWSFFSSIYGRQILDKLPVFDDYYRTEYRRCRASCPKNEQAADLIETARQLGFRIVLATNPLFPRVAVEERIGWAGLKPDDFEWITSYENSHFTKPDRRYFEQTAQAVGVRPENILMIGNDLKEDYGAAEAGMQLYILTDCLIPCEGRSVDDYPHGNMSDLIAYLRKLPRPEKSR